MQWMAPNVITLLGLMFPLLSCVIYLPFDANVEQAFPMATYVVCAFSIFMYQTFDAVDGKQARRTQQSSPLGQLFDHGCDAINTSLICFIFCQSMQLGPPGWMYFLYQFWSVVTFYGSQWEEHETHILRHGVAWFGVTERKSYLDLYSPMVHCINDFGQRHFELAHLQANFWRFGLAFPAGDQRSLDPHNADDYCLHDYIYSRSHQCT